MFSSHQDPCHRDFFSPFLLLNGGTCWLVNRLSCSMCLLDFYFLINVNFSWTVNFSLSTAVVLPHFVLCQYSRNQQMDSWKGHICAQDSLFSCCPQLLWPKYCLMKATKTLIALVYTLLKMGTARDVSIYHQERG